MPSENTNADEEKIDWIGKKPIPRERNTSRKSRRVVPPADLRYYFFFTAFLTVFLAVFVVPHFDPHAIGHHPLSNRLILQKIADTGMPADKKPLTRRIHLQKQCCQFVFDLMEIPAPAAKVANPHVSPAARQRSWPPPGTHRLRAKLPLPCHN